MVQFYDIFFLNGVPFIFFFFEGVVQKLYKYTLITYKSTYIPIEVVLIRDERMTVSHILRKPNIQFLLLHKMIHLSALNVFKNMKTSSHTKLNVIV